MILTAVSRELELVKLQRQLVGFPIKIHLKTHLEVIKNVDNVIIVCKTPSK